MIPSRWRAAGALIMIMLLVSGCGTELVAQPAEGPTPSPAPTRPPYDPDDLRTVTRQDLLDAVTGRATVEPKLSEELFFRRDGRVGTIEVANGDEVAKGDIVARLEQVDLEYQIGLARIDVDLAELKEQQAREAGLSELETEIVAKEAERARLALERLITEQETLLVRAPYAGRISELTLKPGSEVTAYQPIATIVGTEELSLVAEFTGPKSGLISTGQPIELADFFQATSTFTATVAGRVTPSGNLLVLEPAPGAPPLKLGDSFKATAVLGRAAGVLTIPSAALKTIGDRRYVLLVEDGDLRRVFVESGIESEGIVEIRSGLEEGQQISER
jgi:RND family efflux transporter MFP subunit